jgi:monolysocardiolipin acyltransferase
MTTSLLSRATVTAVGLTCKTFLNIGFVSVTVNGLPILTNALQNNSRRQGVVTGLLLSTSEFVMMPN